MRQQLRFVYLTRDRLAELLAQLDELLDISIDDIIKLLNRLRHIRGARDGRGSGSGARRRGFRLGGRRVVGMRMRVSG